VTVPANFEAAFDRLFALAENTARAVVIDPATAEKVAVETMARARSRWDRVGATGDPTAWVLRTAMALADKAGPKPVGSDEAVRSPKEQLELVQWRSDRLRTRRKAAVIALVAVLLGSAVIAAIALTSSSGSKKVAAGEATTTTASTFPETTSTVPPATTTTAATTPTTLAPATTVAAVAATTTSLPCRNSKDARCGTFRWDPSPGSNSPISISVAVSPENPHVGDVVTFTAHVVDPDASPIIAGEQTCNPPGYGDVGTSRCTARCAAPGYGPWTPPARQRGERTVTYTHTYSDAGSYTAHFWFGSAGASCPANPYASADDMAVQVTVSASP